MDIKTQLKKLILDDDFMSIEDLATEEINLMSILKISHKELQHSNLLSWLFDVNGSHKLNDYFLKEFIKLYFRENQYQDLGTTNSSLSVFDFVEMNFEDLEILREHKHIDLLILSKSNGLCIVIENKIFASEGKGQLKKYRNYASEQFKDYKHKIFIYLSLLPQEISKEEESYYVKITYSHIQKMIQNIIERNTGIARNTRFLLEQYLQTLKSLMNENEEIEKIAKELYKKYKSAFDVVFKYTKPNKSNRIEHNLQELIDNEITIRPYLSSKTYVRFQPKFLLNHIDNLKAKGILDKEDNLDSSWLYLFEFNVTKSSINFDLKIGDYANSECREELFKLYMNNKTFFNKVERKNKQLSPSWHNCYQFKIVTSKEYDEFIESEDENMFELIRKRFEKLITKELPKFEDIIINYLNE